ncbi:hypothetical protein ACFQ0M_17130 [Kitasatospora aburaviensis]
MPGRRALLVGPTAASTVRDDHGDQDQTPGLDLLAGWARTVLDDRQRANDWTGWVRPAGHDWERTASRAVKVLLLHLDWAATRQYARDLADEIGRLHGHLNRVSGTPFTTGPARRHVCARCKLMTATIRPDGMCECSAPTASPSSPPTSTPTVQSECSPSLRRWRNGVAGREPRAEPRLHR